MLLPRLLAGLGIQGIVNPLPWSTLPPAAELVGDDLPGREADFSPPSFATGHLYR